MYLKDMNELPTVDFSTLELSTEQKKFCQEFSYAPMENPLETIREIFNSWFAQQRRRFQREPIPYICDFSRCRLNVRLTACIQPLLRGHKYRVSALFGSCLLAAHANSGFILRKIWGRLQTVVTFWGIEMLEDWHLSYHFKLFDIITIFGRFLGVIHSPYNFFAFFSIFTANRGRADCRNGFSNTL